MTTHVGHNDTGLCGIDFVEFSSSKPKELHELFMAFGFSRLMRHKTKKIDYYRQNDIHFFLNTEANSFGDSFQKTHGPSICSMGWRVADSKKAIEVATSRGAKAGKGDFNYDDKEVPSIFGIGDSLLYFVENFMHEDRYEKMGFVKLENPDITENKGFISIDHLTNNVEFGTMAKWGDFYKDILRKHCF